MTAISASHATIQAIFSARPKTQGRAASGVSDEIDFLNQVGGAAPGAETS